MNWKLFRILFLAIFSSMLGQGIVVPLLPVYAHELGATGLYLGLIFGAYSVSRSLFLPFVGRLSDARGRKPFITSGLFAYFVTSAAFMFSADVYALILIRFLQGFAAAMVMPVAEAYAGEITPKGKEGTVMGLIGISFAGGLCAGPLIGGIAKDTLGMRSSFLIMALICLSGFFLCSAFLPPREKEHVIVRKKHPVNIRHLLGNKYVSGILLLRFTYAMCLGIVWTFVPLIAETEYKMSGMATGSLITLGVLASAALMTPMGMLADRFSKVFLIATGGFITVCAMFFFTHMQAAWEFYTVVILVGIGDGTATPSVMAMTVVLGRENNSMGAIMSLLTLSESLGMAVGPVLAGIIADKYDMITAFGTGAAIMLVATVITLFLIAGFEK